MTGNDSVLIDDGAIYWDHLDRDPRRGAKGRLESRGHSLTFVSQNKVIEMTRIVSVSRVKFRFSSRRFLMRAIILLPFYALIMVLDWSDRPLLLLLAIALSLAFGALLEGRDSANGCIQIIFTDSNRSQVEAYISPSPSRYGRPVDWLLKKLVQVQNVELQ